MEVTDIQIKSFNPNLQEMSVYIGYADGDSDIHTLSTSPHVMYEVGVADGKEYRYPIEIPTFHLDDPKELAHELFVYACDYKKAKQKHLDNSEIESASISGLEETNLIDLLQTIAE